EQRLALYGGNARDPWASDTALLQAANLIAEEAQRVLGGERSRVEGHLFLMHLKTLQTTRHFILPDALCPNCGSVPDDSPEAARLTLKPSPKVNPHSFRCRSIDALRESLLKDYVDDRAGFLINKGIDQYTPFAVATVKLPLIGQDETAGGRSHSYAESTLTAILEGLERYCGIAPNGKRIVVQGSYRELESQAMNPESVGVHAPEQYASGAHHYAPFDPDQPITWVWGYSFQQDRPILVPESLTYYGGGCGQGYVFETSNGCAMGGSLEEAIFYGILEVVERDAFLMTWYAQLPLPRLDLSSVQDQELQLMIARLRTAAGYDLHVFHATMEHGIPSVWAILKNRKPQGANVVCVAAAHLDPVRAVKGAMQEMAGMIGLIDHKIETEREKIERMLDDPFLLTDMSEHCALYGLPQAEERLGFLLNEDRPLQPFDTAFTWPAKHHADLTDDLKDVLQVFERLQLDVIVVDQTTPEMKRNGLYCVKVLIPGMLPMTFGHRNTRVTGLERVLKVPMQLGYVPRPLTVEQLNPHPHPFP
ncbi:MAG: TOMM precursor leader peptide-binding protein, partial [Tumebacillaceae bacterium]